MHDRAINGWFPSIHIPALRDVEAIELRMDQIRIKGHPRREARREKELGMQVLVGRGHGAEQVTLMQHTCLDDAWISIDVKRLEERVIALLALPGDKEQRV